MINLYFIRLEAQNMWYFCHITERTSHANKKLWESQTDICQIKKSLPKVGPAVFEQSNWSGARLRFKPNGLDAPFQTHPLKRIPNRTRFNKSKRDQHVRRQGGVHGGKNTCTDIFVVGGGPAYRDDAHDIPRIDSPPPHLAVGNQLRKIIFTHGQFQLRLLSTSTSN